VQFETAEKINIFYLSNLASPGFQLKISRPRCNALILDHYRCWQ